LAFFVLKRGVQILFLIVILLIPVLIFLFLKGAGENKFAIPVYYTEGVPEPQQFDCNFPVGAYSIAWADSLDVSQQVLLYFNAQKPGLNASDKRNMFRRILQNVETPLRFMVFYTGDEDVAVEGAELILEEDAEMIQRLHCMVASDTLNQFVLADTYGRIRGYYNTSLEEQDRLLVELKILNEEQ